MRGRLALCAVVVLAGCQPRPSPQASATPRYIVGKPYVAGGVWRYPREQFDYDETGLATVTNGAGGLTADGEIADQGAMAAAHPTLQLPAVAQVTDLDTGYQVLVRINDRGPTAPGRMIALTPRALQLLHADGAAAVRVHVVVVQADSLALAGDLGGDEAPHLTLAVVPATGVAEESLPPLPGARQAAPIPVAAQRPVAKPPAVLAPLVPLRLPETVSRVFPRPGRVYVEAASFGHREYAELLRLRLASLGAQVSTSYDAPRERAYRVRIGPLSVAAADAMLARTLAAGVADARIVAE